jgi:hypothetical protein
VIEVDVLLPRNNTMTILAGRAQRAGMHIHSSVAGHALLRRFAICDFRNMAVMAAQLGVRTTQRELGVALMYEFGFFPSHRLVAGLALGSHASSMEVNGSVAARTVARQLVFKFTGAMARLTGSRFMHAN